MPADPIGPTRRAAAALPRQADVSYLSPWEAQHDSFAGTTMTDMQPQQPQPQQTAAVIVVDPDDVAPPQKPGTAKVLTLLALTSLTFSYLGSYAVAGALVSAEVIRPWSAGADPRPRWLAIGFCSLLATFILLGGVVRCLSRRQLQRIDDMAQEEASA